MMSNRTLAFVVCLPIAAVIGFAAGRATAPLGLVADAAAPDGQSRVRIERAFSLGAPKHRVVLHTHGADTEVKVLEEDGATAEEPLWSPNGELAGVLLNRSKLAVIDPAARRILYELPLLEKMDGTRMARGLSFSTNAMAVTFDDCPRTGAGCRPRFLALPTR
jgi:hypothetical protein